MLPEISLNILDIAENSVRAKATYIEIIIDISSREHLMHVGIKDNGCGMTPEELQAVTDPFFTSRTTRKVGLGIPFLKQSAECTGGTFSIESKKGVGTNVSVTYHTDHIDCMPLGDITETIFCRVTAGVWMSRSSVVWGPFSIVWGLAIALVTALLYKYKDKGDRFLFLTGTLLGGAYEYFCSVFTELVFGKVFWDYSKIPFNLGGRINLLYCFFWGIAAVVWFKILFPPVEKWIEKIPAVAGKILTWVLLGFMVCNILVSCVALVRYDERGNGVQATNAVQKWADAHYDDAKMKKIYPNAKGIN